MPCVPPFAPLKGRPLSRYEFVRFLAKKKLAGSPRLRCRPDLVHNGDRQSSIDALLKCQLPIHVTGSSISVGTILNGFLLGHNWTDLTVTVVINFPLTHAGAVSSLTFVQNEFILMLTHA